MTGAMKYRKPYWKGIMITIGTFILFFLLFHFWDEVKTFLVSLFS